MEIIDEYKTITSTPAEGFYSEKRSKFYAFAHHVETEEQVKDIVQTYRKRFYDARHVCYAFMLGADSSLFRTNDDGEQALHTLGIAQSVCHKTVVLLRHLLAFAQGGVMSFGMFAKCIPILIDKRLILVLFSTIEVNNGL